MSTPGSTSTGRPRSLSHGATPLVENTDMLHRNRKSQRLCEIAPDAGGRATCAACKVLETFVAFPPDQEMDYRILLHSNFAELDACAKICLPCREFRKAVIMGRPTIASVNSLWEHDPWRFMEVWVDFRAYDIDDPDYFPDNVDFHLELQDPDLDRMQRCAYIGMTTKPIDLSNSSIPREVLTHSALQLPDTANSESTFRQVRYWASDCYNTHPHCADASPSRALPTRLLAIGAQGLTVRIIDTLPLSGDDVKYTALSYCWGIEPTASTLRNNVKNRMEKHFSTQSLPRTIRDAIEFTSKSGVDYIWIDALCIIQDSPSDWRSEAARMQSVYSSAYFTISAIGSQDSNTGLFQTRKAWKYPNEPAYISKWRVYSQPMDFWTYKAWCPWSERGWTYQEEVLSPRLVYITPSRIYWSCRQARYAEQSSLGTHKTDHPDNLPNDTRPNHWSAAVATHEDPAFHPHSTWGSHVNNYSGRMLSHASDRLIALSGIATVHLTLNPQDNYIAGIWELDLGLGLAWQSFDFPVLRKDQNELTIFPSWSWASYPMKSSVTNPKTQTTPEVIRLELIRPGRTSEIHSQQSIESRIMAGNKVTSITVRGRMRPMVSSTSKRLPPWDRSEFFRNRAALREWQKLPRRSRSETFVGVDRVSAEKPLVDNNCGREVYCVHAEDYSNSVIYAYQPGMSVTYGVLDYMDDVDEVRADLSKVMCLELSSQHMLLLKSCLQNGLEQEFPTFQRIGVSDDFDTAFFCEAEKMTVTLV